MLPGPIFPTTESWNKENQDWVRGYRYNLDCGWSHVWFLLFICIWCRSAAATMYPNRVAIFFSCFLFLSVSCVVFSWYSMHCPLLCIPCFYNTVWCTMFLQWLNEDSSCVRLLIRGNLKLERNNSWEWTIGLPAVITLKIPPNHVFTIPYDVPTLTPWPCTCGVIVCSVICLLFW